jgi:hypothetical protein
MCYNRSRNISPRQEQGAPPWIRTEHRSVAAPQDSQTYWHKRQLLLSLTSARRRDGTNHSRSGRQRQQQQDDSSQATNGHAWSLSTQLVNSHTLNSTCSRHLQQQSRPVTPVVASTTCSGQPLARHLIPVTVLLFTDLAIRLCHRETCSFLVLPQQSAAVRQPILWQQLIVLIT